jgi:hypothetical protein
MNEPVSKVLRCAIYTRKSTEHNLDLAFTSLDALPPDGKGTVIGTDQNGRMTSAPISTTAGFVMTRTPNRSG